LYSPSPGAHWTMRSNIFNQGSAGLQSNYEEFRPGNTLSIYDPEGARRVVLPLIDSPQITQDQLPIPRNNPVYNVSDTITWLRGKHTYTMGGTFRRTTMHEAIGGAPAQFSLGVVSADPVSSIFNSTSIPGLRSADQGTVLQLYALLTGRISRVSETYNIADGTTTFGLNPLLRREAQNVGG